MWKNYLSRVHGFNRWFYTFRPVNIIDIGTIFNQIFLIFIVHNINILIVENNKSETNRESQMISIVEK